jgi:hypothetical protein
MGWPACAPQGFSNTGNSAVISVGYPRRRLRRRHRLGARPESPKILEKIFNQPGTSAGKPR